MPDNINLKYEQINWGWLNDYAGYKFAPITFLNQIYTENGDSFKTEYDSFVNQIQNGDLVIEKAQSLAEDNGDGTFTLYTTSSTKPVQFKNGIPKEISTISGMTTVAATTIEGTTIDGTTVKGDTFTFNNPLALKVGLTSKNLSTIKSGSELEWDSNEIGFFGFRDAGTAIASGTDLNSIVVPGAYYSSTQEITASIQNKPTGITQTGFRLLVLPIYHNVNAARSHSKQYLFDAGTAIYVRKMTVSDNTVTWSEWRKTSFLDDIPDIQLTGDVIGTINKNTGKIATTIKVVHPKTRADLTTDTSKYISFMDNSETALRMGHIHSQFSKETNRNYMRMTTYAPTSNELKAGFYVYINKDGAAEAGVYSDAGVTAATGTRYENNSKIVFMGAAWNDYAEFRDQVESLEAGYCVASTNDGKVYKTTEKFQACDGIVSDTYGFAIGRTEQYQTPLAVSGRVLAYFHGNREDYNSGDTVCAGPEGKIMKMTREEIREYPDRIIGIVSEIPEYEEWNDKKVNNRIWIKVK